MGLGPIWKIGPLVDLCRSFGVGSCGYWIWASVLVHFEVMGKMVNFTPSIDDRP